ncbi:cation transporter protein [Mucor ambiguus]|uniref:Cation transporter protein n=1 Tax=Mucor ambiguus TaxID=91626 RepID=A0A0C9MMA1_9FUNG|nr:cation transporter protein [Mucor ambiguus]
MVLPQQDPFPAAPLSPGTTYAYIDTLFMSTSAVTNTGLNTINMSSLSTWQTLVMYFGSFFGSHVMISIIIVYVRRHYFSKRFEDILAFNKAQRLREANRRKFERNISEIEKQRRKSTGESIKGDEPLRRRLSFISLKSSTKDDDTMPQPVTARRKKGRFSAPRPLSAGLSHFDLMAHFKKKHSQSIGTDQPMQNMYDSASETQSESDPHQVVHPHEAHVKSISHDTNMADEDDISMSTLQNNSNHSEEDTLPIRASSESCARTHPLGNTATNPSISSSSHRPNLASSNHNASHSILFADDSRPHHSTDTTNDDGNDEHNNTVSGNQGIAFAENIERQREIARRRLEQDRRFEDILQRIAGETADSTLVPNASSASTAVTDQAIMINAESQDEEMKRIMREPIHKSELTRQQRYRLGGAEYRAIDFLTLLVPIYYLFCILGFGFFTRIYIAASTYAQDVLQTTNTAGPIDPWFYSFFSSISSFNNLGLSLVDASMVPFQSAPCMLILNHPRRCYTTLFPATQTKWLLIVLIGITAVEFITFIALNYWLPVLSHLDWGARILDGLFQSVATRNAGYSVIDLMALNPGTQIVFIVAMYISVYPVAISMRNSNVYQERALGIYSGQDDDDSDYENSNTPNFIHRLKRQPTMSSIVTTSRKVLRKPDFFVMTQIQRQLTSEICWVICCIFAICVIESEAILSPSPITISTVIYECVSAFGNVGASTGYPNTSASQAQQYHTLSKLVLILLMYRGRHRGLPAAIDRAVLLPSEQLEQKEQEDHLLRRRNTSISVGDGNGDPIMFYNRSRTL